MGEVGTPVYCPKPSRGMESQNVIYPIKGGLFVHIYPDPGGQRDYYISIEPTMGLALDPVIAQVEVALMRWAEKIGQIEDEEEKKQLLTNLVEQMCVTSRARAAATAS
jgi:flagellar protein FlaI